MEFKDCCFTGAESKHGGSFRAKKSYGSIRTESGAWGFILEGLETVALLEQDQEHEKFSGVNWRLLFNWN
uniref:Uncharacterized protein n=1 Tax=Strongyloides stercoralis TaxID=6248 RepID=A0A0K0E5P8_STRER